MSTFDHSPPEPAQPHNPLLNAQADAEGKVKFDMPNGGTLTMSPDGAISLDLKQIKAIGLHNIIDVQTHNISTVVGVVSHFVKFHSGGELHFAYNQQGQLIELSFTGVHVTISEDAQLSFSTQQPQQ